jgi:hypothetical protein
VKKLKQKRKPAASKEAKPGRASGDALFSVNAASDVLRRTRRTITRALVDVRPDKIESGVKLWRLSRIITAINDHTFAPILSSVDGDLDGMFDEHFAAEARMRALPTLAERREAAQALIPEIIELDKMTRQSGIANGHESDVVHLRADQMLRLLARGIEGPCEWTHDQVWDLINAEYGEDEAA